MELFPNYYDKFKCIADRCKHSCCIGWEVDIDETTMELYDSLEGEMGNRIRSSIDRTGPHFIMGDNDRCPFLNEKGLCDIICKYGEDAISDICYLHPRFSNFYEEFTETGLGLCCEEAARIILSFEEKFVIPKSDNATLEEYEFLKERSMVFDILQNREIPMGDRLKILASKYDIEFDFNTDKICSFYLSLERLDEAWTKELENIESFNDSIFYDDKFQIFFEQLAVYFIFRHFEKGVFFALISVWLIAAICNKYNDISKMIDIARMYSAEIEYSDENIEKIIKFK